MPVNEGLVLQKLNDKFRGKSVSKTLKASLAKRMAEKIESDEEIEEYINDREDIILEATRDKDAAVTAMAAKTKEEVINAAKGEPAKQDDPPSTEPVEGMPDWFKPFATQFGTLAQTVTGLQKDKAHQTISQRLQSDERTKDIPPNFYKRWSIPENDADFETFAEELKAEYQPFAASATAQQFSTGTPGGGIQTGGSMKLGQLPEPSDDQVKRIAALL